ncbi:MAG TPA: (Fe-S)-binding protein [Candidatus Brocadiia bacterium]|nr:(Fe-S)-binding protein [Candidatus Brocadiia bacterium]
MFLTPQTPAEARHASVRVIEERCNGCLRCVTACPTHALRVRGNQPRLLEHLCIDCAEGMAVCPQRVFALPHGAADELPQECVLVAPSALLAQFPGRVGAEKLRNALRDKGVRDLIVSDGYEAALRKAVARYAMSEARNLPVIAPFCPAVVNLIEFRFPSLIGHLAPFLSPLEAALMDTKGRRSVFAVLCPSQATALRRLGLPAENMLTPAAVCQAARPSLNGSAASARMENPAAGSDAPGRLEVSGIRHVKSVLESLENGRLKDVSILELYSCDQGCFGSPLLFVNPFVARCRWSPEPETGGRAVPAFRRQKSFSPRRGVRLDDDMALAIEKLGGIDRLAKSLPGKNCAACGAPDCASFAEDVVLGRAVLSECPHLKDTEVRREAN